MTDLRHLGFYGSNNGFFEKTMYDFLVVNRRYSSKLLLLRKSRFGVKIQLSKMADLRHLEFWGSNNGFPEKPVYDFVYIGLYIDTIALHFFSF